MRTVAKVVLQAGAEIVGEFVLRAGIEIERSKYLPL